MEQKFFENKLKPMLTYIGTITACITGFAYIFLVVVLIKGFRVQSIFNTTIFSIITAAVGFCIMQMLKIQGQSFAKNLDENVKVMKDWESLQIAASLQQMKGNKFRSMRYYWFTSVLSDALIKCLTLGLTSIGMVYIVVEGSNDWSLLLLAVVNLLMFIGFGFISLTKTYDFYNQSYIPFIRQQIEQMKTNEKTIETEYKQLQQIQTKMRSPGLCEFEYLGKRKETE